MNENEKEGKARRLAEEVKRETGDADSGPGPVVDDSVNTEDAATSSARVDVSRAASRGLKGLEPMLVKFGGEHWRLSEGEVSDLEEAMSAAYPELDLGRYAVHYFWFLILWMFGPRLARTVWEKIGVKVLEGYMMAEAASAKQKNAGPVDNGQRGDDGSDRPGQEPDVQDTGEVQT